jgi:hypothetical protein
MSTNFLYELLKVYLRYSGSPLASPLEKRRAFFRAIWYMHKGADPGFFFGGGGIIG